MAAKKKTTAKKKTEKVKEMSQAHGMVEKKKFQPTSLEQAWGNDGSNKYNTLDLEEYEKQLDSMDKSDMQTQATKVGLIPVDDMKVLRKRLLREFKVHVAQYTKPIVGQNQIDNIDQATRKILEEGR